MEKDSDRLLDILLMWMIFTVTFPTIILYRAAAQPSYQWGLFGVSGEGLSLGSLVVFLAAVWGWISVFLGMREGRPPFGILLVLWNAFLLTSMIYGAVKFGSDMALRGDAMGLRVNIAAIGPVLCGAFLFLSLLWCWRRRNQTVLPSRFQWPPSAKKKLGLALALLPVIVVLFILGDGVDHTNMDRVAIGLVVAQCILVSLALGEQIPMPTATGSDAA